MDYTSYTHNNGCYTNSEAGGTKESLYCHPKAQFGNHSKISQFGPLANTVIDWSSDCFFVGKGWYQSKKGKMTSLFPTSIISLLTADELNGVNVANIRHCYTYRLLGFGQFSDTPLFRTTFVQRSANFSDIGRTRTDFFSETGTTSFYGSKTTKLLGFEAYFLKRCDSSPG